MKLTHVANQQSSKILSLKPNRKSNVEISFSNSAIEDLPVIGRGKIHSARPSFYQAGKHNTEDNIFPSFAMKTQSGVQFENFTTSIVKEVKNQQNNSMNTNFKIQSLQTRIASLERKMNERYWSFQQFNIKLTNCEQKTMENNSKIQELNSTLEIIQDKHLCLVENFQRKFENVTSKLLKYRSQLQFESLKLNRPSFQFIQIDPLQSKLPYKVEENSISVLTQAIRLQFEQIKKDVQTQILDLTTEYQLKRSLSNSIERKTNETIDQSVSSQSSSKEKISLMQIHKKIANKITPFIREKNQQKTNSAKTYLEEWSQIHNLYHMDSQGYLLDEQQNYLVNDEGSKIKLDEKALKLLESLNLFQKSI